MYILSLTRFSGSSQNVPWDKPIVRRDKPTIGTLGHTTSWMAAVLDGSCAKSCCHGRRQVVGSGKSTDDADAVGALGYRVRCRFGRYTAGREGGTTWRHWVMRSKPCGG